MKLDSTTHSLIVNFKLGKEEAMNALFAKYQSKILRIVRFRLSGSLREKLKLQSMDIVQEVFMYAFKHLKDFEPQSEGHFVNWLSKKVQHYIYDRLNYVSREKRKAIGGEISIDQPPTSGDENSHMQIQIESNNTTPTQYIAKKEQELLIDSMLDQLKEEEKELIIHRNLEELTFKEIGAMYNKSEDAVRKKYSRAFKKLIDLSEDTVRPIIAAESYRKLANGI